VADEAPPRRAGGSLQAIRPKRLYQQIAEQIAEMIRAEGLVAGDRLPPEHDLARFLGVSRPSVREALIVLEMVGLIEVRTGSGAYLKQSPGEPWRPEVLAAGPGPIEQFKARWLLECELAAEAARQATEPEIAALEVLVDRTEQAIAAEPHVTADHYQFHQRLAEASRNTVLAAFVAELIAMMQGPVWQAPRQRIDSLDQLEQGVAARRRIIACLRARDADGAKEAMRQHLRRVGRLYFGDDID
jgi:DNA-binding FadR family transcriptional regulator